MKVLIGATMALVLVAGGVVACNMTGGPACSGSQCVQEDDGGEWEIDLDGHRKRRPATTVQQPAAPKPPATKGPTTVRRH